MIFIFVAFFTNCSKEESGIEKCTESTWYQDLDKDGLGNPNRTKLSCTQPSGYVDNSNDNDDLNNETLTIPSTGFSSPESYPDLSLL